MNGLATLRYLALPFHAAHGMPGAPILSMEDANPLGEMRPLLYGVSVAVFYMATAALGELTSPDIASALRLLGLLALPAVLATHTITGSFTEALNPTTVVGVTRRLGSSYFIILAVALACGFAGRAVARRAALAAMGLCAVSLLLGGCATTTPPPSAPRSSHWATPVEAAGIPNLYRVSGSLYRSAQPTRDGIAGLDEGARLADGDAPVRTVVSLRTNHTDASLVTDPQTVQLEHVSVQSWRLQDEDVVRFLRIATDPARQPVLVHCRRGADRTGVMVAIYRVVVEGWTKADAIDEMTRGGYGFRPVWQNLVRYVEELDVEAIRTEVVTPDE